MRLSDFQIDSLGTVETIVCDGREVEVEKVKRVRAWFARKGTNQLMRFWSTEDERGYNFETVDKGIADKTWAWKQSGASHLSALGLTQPQHDRNRGHAIAYRGILTGRAQVRIGSGDRPPTRSEEEDVWYVGDRWLVSPPPASREPIEYICTNAPRRGGSTRAGTLTWVATVWMP